MSRRWIRAATGCALSLLAAGLVPVVAAAHPLGNFTVNQYSGIVVRADGIDVTYVLDMAEIPTAQLLSAQDSDETRLLSGTAAGAYRASECSTIRDGVTVDLDGQAAQLTVASSTLGFPPGAAGLHTTRLTCHLTSSASPVGHVLTYANRNFDDRVGWREVTATGTTARVTGSDVPATSASAELTSYPADLLTSPLDIRGASFTVVAGTGGGAAGTASGPSSILPRGVDQFANAFVALVSQQDVTALFVVLALGLALLLGGIHAFAPGHGKTVMAAYLVGQRGSLRHAAALAGSVTVTHTIGVLALGVALSVSTSFAPTSVYPVLGVVSGLIIVAIGAMLMLRAWRSRRVAQAVSALGESAPHVHGHGGTAHTHPAAVPAPRLRNVLAIGFAGGMVPSPSALVVLIGGIALHRTWFAVLLVLTYGIGMALVLTGTGVALRHARTVIDRRLAARRTARGAALLGRLAGAVPMVTASVVIAVGLGLVLRGGTGI